MAKSINSVKSFNATLGSIKKSAKTLRENVQACFDFGLVQYAEHSNSTFLSQLLTTVGGTQTVKYATLKQYIMAHANVQLVDHKDKKIDPITGKVMKVFRKKEGEAAETTTPSVNWWQFEVESVAKPKDPMQVLKSAYKTIQKAIEDKNVKGSMAEARRELKLLGELIESIKTPAQKAA